MPSTETIFLTGFPGFIAGRLVRRLATDGARFLLLVQPALLERARSEIARLSSGTGVSVDAFQLLEGDITRTELGLSPADLAAARAATTILFHLAAIYDLGVARDSAMRVNVEGTRRVNEFARTLKRLRRYNYVSTCYVAGLRTGVIYERELRHAAGFRNYYEETKYLAELEVEALKEHLPLTIYRPSVVCGDSLTGETAKYDGIYYLINYLLMQPRLLSLANIGNGEVRLNLVPVDFVVEAMSALADDARADGLTLQLADPAPLTTHELFELISRSLTARGSRFTLPAPLVRTSLKWRISESLTGLPRVGAPYFFLKQTYDTTQAQQLLAPHGLRPPPFPTYVNNLINFVKQHPKL
ncbi:MAG TPA: SDR family oxidoreductase [Pyrinomonadaceae bacterium]|nr:SDR family oxidoreductase [Pyrinomonadaceae bacterium]